MLILILSCWKKHHFPWVYSREGGEHVSDTAQSDPAGHGFPTDHSECHNKAHVCSEKPWMPAKTKHKTKQEVWGYGQGKKETITRKVWKHTITLLIKQKRPGTRERKNHNSPSRDTYGRTDLQSILKIWGKLLILSRKESRRWEKTNLLRLELCRKYGWLMWVWLGFFGYIFELFFLFWIFGGFFGGYFRKKKNNNKPAFVVCWNSDIHRII